MQKKKEKKKKKRKRSLTYLHLLPPILASLEASVTQTQSDISNK